MLVIGGTRPACQTRSVKLDTKVEIHQVPYGGLHSKTTYFRDADWGCLAMKWADQFCTIFQDRGIECIVVNRVNGWPETIKVAGQTCFTKSVTFNISQLLYFQGVDPDKLKAKGDYVLICGGIGDHLRTYSLFPGGFSSSCWKKGNL